MGFRKKKPLARNLFQGDFKSPLNNNIKSFGNVGLRCKAAFLKSPLDNLAFSSHTESFTGSFKTLNTPQRSQVVNNVKDCVHNILNISLLEVDKNFQNFKLRKVGHLELIALPLNI